MPDDTFHEIQLSGKPLVFVFMAATVVAVVIFLCGVLVGRGVHAARGYTDIAGTTTTGDVTPSPASASAPPTSTTGSAASPSQAPENLSYYERLDGQQPPPEAVKDEPVGEPAAAAEASTKGEPAPAETPEPRSDARAASAGAATMEPAGGGWSVQVAAIKDRAEAESVAKRLSSKGYPAYVMAPSSAAALFRVRVGKFKDRREAEAVAGRLQRNEQFRPWVVR